MMTFIVLNSVVRWKQLVYVELFGLRLLNLATWSTFQESSSNVVLSKKKLSHCIVHTHCFSFHRFLTSSTCFVKLRGIPSCLDKYPSSLYKVLSKSNNLREKNCCLCSTHHICWLLFVQLWCYCEQCTWTGGLIFRVVSVGCDWNFHNTCRLKLLNF